MVNFCALVHVVVAVFGALVQTMGYQSVLACILIYLVVIVDPVPPKVGMQVIYLLIIACICLIIV